MDRKTALIKENFDGRNEYDDESSEFTGWTVLILRNVIYIVLNVQKKRSERGLNRMESAEFIFWILEIITM